jgi:trimeric autotransporter adhesin
VPSAPSAAAISACIGALRTAPTRQQIQRDQQALTRSQTDLMTAVTLAVTTAGNTKTPAAATPAASGQSATVRSATSQTFTTRSSGAQSTGGPSGGSGQSSASRVVSDQAAVTTAQDALTGARADLSSATLKASIAGTVGSVSLVTGASSAGTSIIIVGAGAVAVTVNVPLASMGAVHVGQKAIVSPQGTTGSVTGSVTSVSLLPSTSTSGSTTGRATTQGSTPAVTSGSPVYPVVVLVPEALPALASGSRADVSLLIGTAAHVLTVPNSALTPLGNGQAVALTFKNGVATRALVKTGYAGLLTTQVTSGLTAGQQVVLADLSTALPTNTTSSRRFGVGGASGSGLAGGGLGGAGLGGGGTGGAGLGGGGFPPRG